MAEKEERIILTVNVFKEHPCADCGNPYKPNCGNGKFPACDLKRKYKKGLTKETAIERMAKAMFEWQRPGSGGDVPIEDVWQNERIGFENLAEAALNALLGWKK